MDSASSNVAVPFVFNPKKPYDGSVDLVDWVAGIVGNRTGVVVMHAAEALGREMGSEHIKILPPAILADLGARLSTTVHVAPLSMRMKVEASGFPAEELGPANVTHMTATIGGVVYGCSIAGELAQHAGDPLLWGEDPDDCIKRGFMEQHIEFKVSEVHPWWLPVPTLALVVERRKRKRRCSGETLEETQDRQLKRFRRLFDTPLSDMARVVDLERVLGVIKELDQQWGVVLPNSANLNVPRIMEAASSIDTYLHPAESRCFLAAQTGADMYSAALRHIPLNEFIVAMGLAGFWPCFEKRDSVHYKRLMWVD